MPADFDPYHVWLGIPPDEQPPNRYRLLGIRPFEPNAEVIDSAADRQSAHLRTFQAGKHAAISQRLLNEVAAARVCLLNPQNKAIYDQQLRSAIAASIAQTPAPRPSAVHSGSQLAQPANLPVAQSMPAPRAQPSAPSAANWDDLIGPHEVKASKSSGTFRKRASAPKSNTKFVLIGVGGALLAAAVVAVLLVNANAEAVLIFDWPAGDRAGAALTIDGEPVAIPASGPWEFHCKPGAHLVAAARPAYRFSREIEVPAGDRLSIAPDWKPKAVLIVNWPLAARTAASLTDNGQPIAVTAREPFELAVEPGRHILRLSRRNAEPIETAVTVADEQRQSVALLGQTATLRINWPIADRHDGKLTIDGKEQPITARELAFPLDPGRHNVRLVRDGFEPIEEIVEASADPLKPIMPIWVHQKTAVAANSETSTTASVATTPSVPRTAPTENRTQAAQKEASAADAAADKKLPVPALAEQKQIGARIDQDFKPNASPDDERRVAERLFALADESGTQADERYVALIKAIGWASKAGDFDSAVQGIDRLAEAYDIDPFETKRQTIDDALKGGASPERTAAALAAAEQAAEQAADASRFDIALALCDAASKAAGTLASDSQAKKEAIERVARRRRDFVAMQTASAAALEAKSTLDKDPDNAEANSALGRWYCLFKRDWDRGLPLLAKGQDAALKSPAERELTAELQLRPQLMVADRWWDAGQKETGIVRDSLLLHAGEIYRLMLPNVESKKKKTGIEKRLAEVQSIVVEPVQFPRGRWVDVLKLVDTTKDAVKGKWSRNGSEVSCEPEEGARISVPIVVNGSYDLEVAFTRSDGDCDVNTIFAAGGQQCSMLLSMAHGVSGLDRIDGKRPTDEGNPTTIRPGTLVNGHRCRLLISVRIPQPEHASVDVSLDGKPYLPHWEGNPALLSLDAGWRMPDVRQLGLAAWSTRVTFHSMRLKLIAGQATNLASNSPSESKPKPESHRASRTTVAHRREVDLLKLVDVGKDSVAGKWQMRDHALVCDSEEFTRIEFPYQPPEEYDFQIVFTRNEGSDGVVQICAAGERQFMWEMDGWDGHCGFELINGNNLNENPTKKPGPLTNRQKYTSVVKVRRDGIQAFLDDKLVDEWKTDYTDMSLFPGWNLHNPTTLGLGTWASSTVFLSVTVIEITGKGKPVNRH